MRVLIEASSAYDQYAGIGRYARNVITHLHSIAEPADDLRLVHTRDRIDLDLTEFETSVRDLSNRTIPLSRRNAYRIWFRLGLPIDVQWFLSKSDVAYSPDFTIWHTNRIPRIITVHDLVYVTHPEHTVPGLLSFLETVVDKQIEQAAKIAVVSHATAADLSRYAGVSADRMVYAPNAVDDRFFMASPLTEQEREALGLPAEFALMVGTLEPRKNHVGAIHAYELSEAAKHFPLVIVGREGWGLDRIIPTLTDAQVKGVVRYLSFFPDDALPRLMASARMLVFPSWNEGFGLPVAEMLATGGNVVTSTAPALLEVAGGFGESADAGDIEGLARAIDASIELPSDALRKQRRDWISSCYSWETTADTLLRAMHELV